MVAWVGFILFPGSLQGQSKDPSNPDADKRVRLMTTVTNAMVSSFVQGRAISVRIPAGQNAIGSLVVKLPASFKNDPVGVKPTVNVRDSVAYVEVPRTLFERLEYQPLRLRVYETGISSIQLLPVDGPERISPNAPRLNKLKIEPDFFVRLKSKTGFSIATSEEVGFRINNDVIDHEIPFAAIRGIYFDASDPKKSTVVLNNGDNLTGNNSWPEMMEFETRWGKEKISLDQIESLTRRLSSQVIKSGTNSPRLLIEKK